jgi:hypothetical protein
LLSKKVQLFCTGEGAHRRTFIQIPGALPFSQNNRIRIFTDTIRLSADSLIVPVDRIRKSADRIRKSADTIRKPTSRQNHFSSTKNPKIHKKNLVREKIQQISIFLEQKNSYFHKYFPASSPTHRFSPLQTQQAFINFS